MSHDVGIGHLSDMLGISTNGLRFLEDEGLIHPRRNDANGYRYYSLNDRCTLYMYKMFHSTGMQLKDIQDAMSKTPDDAIRMVRNNINDLRNELQHAEEMADEVENLLQRAVPLHFTVEQRPHLYCRQANLTDLNSNGTDKVEEGRDIINAMPLCFPGILFHPNNAKEHFERTRIVITENKDLSNKLFGEKAFEFDENPSCLHGVILYENASPDERCLIEPHEWLLQHNNIRYTGEDIVSRFLHLQVTDDGYLYRLELWIPIEEVA